ncbi:MAG: hypothetical protein QXI59_00040 [Candidatus Bathyarchaeia archaeon]
MYLMYGSSGIENSVSSMADMFRGSSVDEIIEVSYLHIRDLYCSGEEVMLPKSPLERLLELKEEIRFSQQEIDKMMKDSKREWSKV